MSLNNDLSIKNIEELRNSLKSTLNSLEYIFGDMTDFSEEENPYFWNNIKEKINENDAYARYSLAKTLEEYFKIHNIRVVPELELFDGNEVVDTHSITYPVSEDFCRDLVDIMYKGDNCDEED